MWFIFMILHPKANPAILVKITTISCLLCCVLRFSDVFVCCPHLNIAKFPGLLYVPTLGSKTFIDWRLTQKSELCIRELPFSLTSPPGMAVSQQ